MRRVLLVDDDEAVLRSLERLVHRFRPCVRAVTIAEARYALESTQLCGLIVDVTLEVPGDGLDVMRAFRAAHPHAPILVLTGDPCARAMAAAFDAGAKIIVKGTAAGRIDSFAMECACADSTLPPAVQHVIADWARRAQLTLKEVEVLEGAVRGRRVSWFVQFANLSEPAYRARTRSLLTKLQFANLDEAVNALLLEALQRTSVLEARL